MADQDDLDAMRERLDEVGKKIDEARDHAEDDDILIDPDERRFVESGGDGAVDADNSDSDADDDADDQTIAPPG